MIDANTSLGDLVTADPGRVMVLEGLGLDFCCHGERSLAQACTEAGRDVGRVVALLEAATVGPGAAAEWATLDPAGLVDHIVVTHHAYLRREAPTMASLARKVLGAHGERHAELGAVTATYARLWAELEPHLDEEEATLFPAIREDRAVVADDVRHLEGEHEAVGALLDELRTLTGDFTVPDDGCASYDAFYRGLEAIDRDTRLHVHKENNVLFPAVAAAAL
ncbi:iron-sulfur cluster repair di-iron protein [Iamia sp.]|uniref:iron-sulfur cluster repair di-iron protein n=1 Tax=Iamia sp. TaxID=2722710 RepID=UPI002C85DCA3|nr:iron-sulfur cluster repair di-iron protein [Iamia sp.]HXH58167.1 iron-sulfur cluster repair di-iron protein [Iamia sp.]